MVLKSQKEECHPGEDIFNASFHNDIKITTWDTWEIGVAEEEVLNSKSHPGENIVNAYFIKIITITWASPNTANNVSFGVLALWRV